MHAGFGLEENKIEILQELLSKHQQHSSVEAQIVLLQAYQTAYGIYDHLNPDPNRPLAMVGYHPKENYLEHTGFKRAMRRYALHQVHKHFGLNWNDFLELPAPHARWILELSQELSEKRNKALGNIQNDLDL